jgi:hypothetical protein
MIDKQWFIRIGALLLILGFFIPVMSVSCTGLVETKQSVSLASLASTFQQSVLYLFLIGALAVLFLSFLPQAIGLSRQTIWWSELAGTAIGLVSIFVVVISLSNDLGQIGMSTSPEIGALALLAGYGLVGYGLAATWKDTQHPAWEGGSAPERGYREPSNDDGLTGPVRHHPGTAEVSYWLEIVKGELKGSTVVIDKDIFYIGRNQENDLVFSSDPSVSRRHLRLRFDDGVWWIQDTKSSYGFVVNGKQIYAGQLHSGDRIQVGNNEMVFYSRQ